MSAAEKAALALSPEERLKLIETLWESLRADVGDALLVDEATKSVLDQRLAGHAADGSTLTWDEVKAKALADE